MAVVRNESKVMGSTELKLLLLLQVKTTNALNFIRITTTCFGPYVPITMEYKTAYNRFLNFSFPSCGRTAGNSSVCVIYVGVCNNW